MLLLLMGCQSVKADGISVHLHIDGTDRVVHSTAPTVRILCQQLDVQLTALDHITPPLWTPLEPGMTITVTRTRQERREVILTSTVKTVRDEFLTPEKSREVAAASDGLSEELYRVTYDGPTVMQRELIDTRVVVPPREGLRLQGTRGTVPSTPISGTLAYIANGDAWLIHKESGEKRPLTRGGRLDGRVFSLSHDGARLLYTTIPTDTQSALNQLWLIDTHVINTQPRATGIQNVRWASWAPDGQRFAYSSANIARGAPGWHANNDLYMVSWPDLTSTPVAAPDPLCLYAWWGENWAWRVDGAALAYARANEIGILSMDEGPRETIHRFAPFHTHSDWVWQPVLAWHPKDQRLAAIIHRGDPEMATFDLILHSLDGSEPLIVSDRAGAWSEPAWSPDGKMLAYGLRDGEEPESYQLMLATGPDGSLPTPVMPNVRVPYVQLAWAPTSRQIALVHEGDLILVDVEQHTTVPLTATGLASNPQWR